MTVTKVPVRILFGTRLFITFFVTSLLMGTPVYSGVDFSMSGYNHTEFVIPIFEDEKEAEAFGHKVKWVEQIRLELIKRREDLTELFLEAKDGTLEGLAQARYYDIQFVRCGIALRIIDAYRALGVRGDPAMGSTVYAGEMPV